MPFRTLHPTAAPTRGGDLGTASTRNPGIAAADTAQASTPAVLVDHGAVHRPGSGVRTHPHPGRAAAVLVDRRHRCDAPRRTVQGDDTVTEMSDGELREYATFAMAQHDPAQQEGNGYNRCEHCHYTRHPCDVSRTGLGGAQAPRPLTAHHAQARTSDSSGRCPGLFALVLRYHDALRGRCRPV